MLRAGVCGMWGRGGWLQRGAMGSLVHVFFYGAIACPSTRIGFVYCVHETRSYCQLCCAKRNKRFPHFF